MKKTKTISRSCIICKTKASIEVSSSSYQKFMKDIEITKECQTAMKKIKNKEILLSGMCSSCSFSKYQESMTPF